MTVRLYDQRVCKRHLFSDNAKSPSTILHQSVVPARDRDFITSSIAMGASETLHLKPDSEESVLLLLLTSMFLYS